MATGTVYSIGDLEIAYEVEDSLFNNVMAEQRVYLAGKMTGVPDHNFPEFMQYANMLRGKGLIVVNPAELDQGDTTQSWEFYLRRDLGELLACTCVAVIPGWQSSIGARFEALVAFMLGTPVYCARIGKRVSWDDVGGMVLGAVVTRLGANIASKSMWEWENVEESDDPEDEDSILQEAENLIHGARNKDYGDVWDDWQRTADMWSAILGVPVTPEQGLLCMIAVKLSRQVHSPKRDNLVDICGYAALIQEVIDHNKKGESDGFEA